MTAEKKRGILFAFVYTITAVALLFGIYAVYNLIAVQKPWTIGVVYASKLEANDQQVPIVTVKVSSNQNNNGQDLYEIQFNSYTDSEGNGVAGFGIQAVGRNWEIYNFDPNSPYDCWSSGVQRLDELSRRLDSGDKVLMQNNTFMFGDVYLYYTGDNGVIHYSISDSDLDDYLLIDIDGQSYRLVLKEYTYTTSSGALWWQKTETHTARYSWFEVFDYIIGSALENSGSAQGYEEYPLSLMDLAHYFTVEYKDEDDQYHPMADTAENRTYLTIQCDYALDGATELSDSMFNIVANSTTWSYYNNTSVSDYWLATTEEFTLDESMLNYIYYDSYEGYYLTLDAKLENYLKTAKESVKVVINIDRKTDYTLSGIDLNNFTFNISSFEILNAPSDFEILNQGDIEVTYGTN